MTGSGTSGGSRLRIGGWVQQTAVPAQATSADPPGAEPPLDEPDDEQQAWDRLAEPDHPVPAADGPADDDQGAYRGRRRRRGQPRRAAITLRAAIPGRAAITRRAAVLVVAAGVLLIGAGVVVARLLESDPATDRAPVTVHQASPGGSAAPAPGPGPTSPATATPTATGSPAPAPPGSSYEAEAGEAGSHGQVVGMDGASGGQVVRLSGNRNGTFVRFTDVVAAEPGPYQLTIFYFCDQGRDGTVSINNEDHLTVEFPSRGEGGTVGSVTVSTTLAAGTNTIWIGTSGGSPLSLDRIALTR